MINKKLLTHFTGPVVVNFALLITLSFLVSSCSRDSVTTDDFYEYVELPDGSSVIMNHNSSIQFDKDFEERNISLQGEAYFDVVPSDVPFIVTTDLGEITVLGTRFNVNSREDDLEVEVETGKVELETGEENTKLFAGQGARFNHGKAKVEIGKANLEFKIWLKKMEIEFEKMGREIKKESKSLGKEIKKESKKLNRLIKKEVKKIKD